MEQRKRGCLNALIIGICIVVSCGFLAFGLSHFRSDSTHVISATGSSSVDFESDIIIWRGSFSSVADTSQKAYSKIKKDAERVKQYLLQYYLRSVMPFCCFTHYEKHSYKNYRENKPYSHAGSDIIPGILCNLSHNSRSYTASKVASHSKECKHRCSTCGKFL